MCENIPADFAVRSFLRRLTTACAQKSKIRLDDTRRAEPAGVLTIGATGEFRRKKVHDAENSPNFGEMRRKCICEIRTLRVPTYSTNGHVWMTFPVRKKCPHWLGLIAKHLENLGRREFVAGIQLDRLNVRHPFTQLKQFASEKIGDPMIVAGGKSIRIGDAQRRSYTDGLAGLYRVSMGYGQTSVVEVIARHDHKLVYYEEGLQ